jgi:hypothetical protein
MNCDSFQERVIETSRDVARGKAVPKDIEGHIEKCASCLKRFQAEVAMRRAMDELAERLEWVQVPAAIEQELHLLLQERRGKAKTYGKRWPGILGIPVSWAVAAVLLLLVVAAGVLYRPVLRRRIDRAYESKPAVPSQGTGERGQEDFIPLLPVADPNTMVVTQVVRIQMSQKAARDAGFLVGEGTDAQAIEADVLVGSDGVARGIRFVR